MPTFSATRSNHTPSTSVSNWVLDADAAGDYGKVISIGWGGNLTTSTGYETQWARATTGGTGALTALTAEDHDPGYSTPLITIGHTYATTNETLPAEPTGLHIQYWNAHGGLGYLALPLAAPWIILNGVQNDSISCRNINGTDAGGSQYSVSWSE